MIFKRTAAILALILSLCLASCGKTPPEGVAETLTVAVTTDALYELATYLGGERVTVTKLIPDGTELHDFEPRAKDITALGEADILIVNGLGLEPWIDDVVEASGNSALVTVYASTGITPLHVSESDATPDPHIWLSVGCAMRMGMTITEALTGADPERTEYYTELLSGFVSTLNTMYREYKPRYAAAASGTVVTSHAVLAYLCHEFGLTQESVEGVFAEGEPSPQRLAELVDFCRDNGITTVFAEIGHSAQIAETLARETGARVVTIYTMESAEDGLSYLERMEHNLAAIAEAVGG